MTDPLSRLPSSLPELVRLWRDRARDDARYGTSQVMKSSREFYGPINAALAIAECADELDAALAAAGPSSTPTGSNGEVLNPPLICPACGSTEGHLGTANAYFSCRACAGDRYWTENHEPPNDWQLAVSLSPFGRRRDLYEIICTLRARLVEREQQLKEARYNARVLAWAWKDDARPPGDIVKAALAYEVDQR